MADRYLTTEFASIRTFLAHVRTGLALLVVLWRTKEAYPRSMDIPLRAVTIGVLWVGLAQFAFMEGRDQRGSRRNDHALRRGLYATLTLLIASWYVAHDLSKSEQESPGVSKHENDGKIEKNLPTRSPHIPHV